MQQTRTMSRADARRTHDNTLPAVSGVAGMHASQRRRIFAALRRAHRVLGMKRDGLGLGVGLNGSAVGPMTANGVVAPASLQAGSAALMAGGLLFGLSMGLAAIPAAANRACQRFCVQGS